MTPNFKSPPGEECCGPRAGPQRAGVSGTPTHYEERLPDIGKPRDGSLVVVSPASLEVSKQGRPKVPLAEGTRELGGADALKIPWLPFENSSMMDCMHSQVKFMSFF